jgi:hypothetical protein
MKCNKRKFISVYFDDRPLDGRKKRDITIAFNPTEALYDICKDLGSSEIKAALRIYSYHELVKKAQEDHRTLSNFIKARLKEKLIK